MNASEVVARGCGGRTGVLLNHCIGREVGLFTRAAGGKKRRSGPIFLTCSNPAVNEVVSVHQSPLMLLSIMEVARSFFSCVNVCGGVNEHFLRSENSQPEIGSLGGDSATAVVPEQTCGCLIARTGTGTKIGAWSLDNRGRVISGGEAGPKVDYKQPVAITRSKTRGGAEAKEIIFTPSRMIDVFLDFWSAVGRRVMSATSHSD